MEKITSQNYVENVLKTEPINIEPIMRRIENPEIIRLLHAVMGIATEAGELVDVLKKHIFYGKELDRVNIQEELGDELWYVGLAVDVMKTTMDDILTGNIEKLRKRYGDKFSEEAAKARDTENELTHYSADELAPPNITTIDKVHLEALKLKAEKWDTLHEKIAHLYADDANCPEGLLTIGETVASYMGYI